MVMKAGASAHDKNTVRRLYSAGRSVEQIAALTHLRPAHVVAICKQIDSGTLRGAKKAPFAVGEPGSPELNIEQKAAEGVIAKELEDYEAVRQREKAEMQAKIDELEAGAKEAEPAKTRRRRAAEPVTEDTDE